MNPRVVGIEILDNYELLVKFDNNENKIFDVKPYLDYDEFKTISDYDEFKKVSFDSGSIKWDSGPDLSISTVYNRGNIYDTLGENEY